MAKVLHYRELIAWQRAMDVAQLVHEVSTSCPKDEIFGLVSQMRRSAVSVPSNIAEGQGRKSTREFQNHLSIAHGSLCEMETQVLLAGRIGFLSKEQLTPCYAMPPKLAASLTDSTTHFEQLLATDHWPLVTTRGRS